MSSSFATPGRNGKRRRGKAKRRRGEAKRSRISLKGRGHLSKLLGSSSSDPSTSEFSGAMRADVLSLLQLGHRVIHASTAWHAAHCSHTSAHNSTWQARIAPHLSLQQRLCDSARSSNVQTAAATSLAASQAVCASAQRVRSWTRLRAAAAAAALPQPHARLVGRTCAEAPRPRRALSNRRATQSRRARSRRLRHVCWRSSVCEPACS